MKQQIHFCTTDDNVRIAYATVHKGTPLVKAANCLSHLEFDSGRLLVRKAGLPRFLIFAETDGTSRAVRSYLTSAKMFSP